MVMLLLDLESEEDPTKSGSTTSMNGAMDGRSPSKHSGAIKNRMEAVCEMRG